jgi:hypothetical protein
MALAYKSLDEEITDIVDTFDASIAPKRIERSNNNKIYLLLKSVAGGISKLRAAAFALRNRFDPRYCDDTDLYSTALQVGTTLRGGAGSLLSVTITNTNDTEQKTLAAGVYRYISTSGMSFAFEITTDILFEPGEARSLSAISAEKGAYAVSENSKLAFFRDDRGPVDSFFIFSCTDNAGQLGYPDEDLYTFRQRILTGGNRQDQLREIEHDIRSLPNIFECNLVFNPGEAAVEYDGILLAPLELLVVITGVPTAEIARIIAEGCLYATHKVNADQVVYYEHSLYLGGKYPVYYKFHDFMEFSLEITYQFDRQKFKAEQVEAAINALLSRYYHAVTHVDTVTEKHIYDLLDQLGMPDVVIMDVNLLVDAVQVPYLTIPSTRIPHLTSTTYTPVMVGEVL